MTRLAERTPPDITSWGATRLQGGDIQLQINGRPIGTMHELNALNLGNMLRAMVLGPEEPGTDDS